MKVIKKSDVRKAADVCFGGAKDILARFVWNAALGGFWAMAGADSAAAIYVYVCAMGLAVASTYLDTKQLKKHSASAQIILHAEDNLSGNLRAEAQTQASRLLGRNVCLMIMPEQRQKEKVLSRKNFWLVIKNSSSFSGARGENKSTGNCWIYYGMASNVITEAAWWREREIIFSCVVAAAVPGGHKKTQAWSLCGQITVLLPFN